jgi:glycosyltransferase involved in cell wall biosynthesis
VTRTLLWWTHRPDPNYSRNRIVRQQIEALGWRIVDFKPALSRFGDGQARLWALPPHDAVWVPCFRQRDVAAARRHARRVRVPLIFDPLISAWDKQVFERRKFAEDSVRARRLLAWESALLQQCDRVVADTAEHAVFFRQRFGVPAEALTVVPVGAEEDLFVPTPMPDTAPPEVLFVGSFIALQGPEVIVEAVRRYRGPAARFTLLGDGPLKARCVDAARGLQNLHFEPWLDYRKLPERLARAQVVLGVFGGSQKAGRVIPNKAYQALAVARPLITREGPAWQGIAQGFASGVWRVPPGDAAALADALAQLLDQPSLLADAGKAARRTYDRFLSERHVRAALEEMFAGLELK